MTGATEAARAAARRVAERRGQAAELAARQRAAQEEQQVAHLLGNLLQARQFPQWLVSEALDELVAVASQTLAALSGGQFDLTHDKGDLFVIDHADADATPLGQDPVGRRDLPGVAGPRARPVVADLRAGRGRGGPA